MARRVVLHIGAPKTGTSALQVFLARNRHALGRAGYRYPANADVEHAAAGLVTSGNAIGLAKYLNPGLRHRVPVAEWMAEFVEAIGDTSSGSEGVIYSSEFLWLADPERLRRLAGLIAGSGCGVTIVAYVRAPDESALSNYSQAVKRHHETRTLDQYVRGPPPRRRTPAARRGGQFAGGALGVLDGYANAFGRENLRVRGYDSAQFAGGSLFEDFLGQVDPELEPARFGVSPFDERVNPSLSAPEAEVIRFLNRMRLPVRVMDEIPRAYQRLHRGSGPGHPLVLSRELADHIRDETAAETAGIEARYLAGRQLPATAPIADGRESPVPSRVTSLATAALAAYSSLRRGRAPARGRPPGPRVEGTSATGRNGHPPGPDRPRSWPARRRRRTARLATDREPESSKKRRVRPGSPEE